MIELLALKNVIEWSEDDQCFIGHCPGIIGPCCHGDSREQVERELCQIVGEWLEIEGVDLPLKSPVKHYRSRRDHPHPLPPVLPPRPNSTVD